MSGRSVLVEDEIALGVGVGGLNLVVVVVGGTNVFVQSLSATLSGDSLPSTKKVENFSCQARSCS